MHQTSRYFSVLTEAFLAEGGTVDKFIGDAVMVFWNAPNPRPDHVERACRAALAGRLACEKLNSQFETEGLKPFFTRFGIHVGDNTSPPERGGKTRIQNSSVPPAASNPTTRRNTPLLAEILQRDLDALVIHAL